MQFKNYTERPLFVCLPEYDDLFPKRSVQRIIDNFVNKLDLRAVEATYKEGGAPPFHPSVLLKVVLYAYSKNIYGCRPIAELCQRDMVCQWYTNFMMPSFSTINRFRSEHLGLERIIDVFSSLVKILVGDGLVSFEECTYTDGTTMESRASRMRLVWVQSVRKNAEGNVSKIESILAQARLQQQNDLVQENEENQEKEEVSTAKEIAKDTEGDGGKKKRSKDVHMSAEKVKEIRREIQSGTLRLSASKQKELEERLDRADRYRDEDDMCGDRSGTATTDPDSVAMHPKDDVRRIGPCLPMYNMQFMTQNQFILWTQLFGKTTDMAVCQPFLLSLPQPMRPSQMAADAGYGSTENYLLAKQLGIMPFFKYSLYDKENAPRYTPSQYQAEYLTELPDGNLKCPGGIMKKTGEEIEEKNGVTVTTAVYRTNQCAQCSLRPQCHGSRPRNYREVKRKKEWAQLKPIIKARLDSREGQQLLHNRSKDVEPTFAHTKWAGNYRRFRHFGIDKCTMDLFIRAIAHNLKKYTKAIIALITSPGQDSTSRQHGIISLIHGLFQPFFHEIVSRTYLTCNLHKSLA